MNRFCKSPIASETIKDIMLRSLPKLNIHLEPEYIKLIKGNYDAEQLYEAYSTILKYKMDGTDKQEMYNRITEILTDKRDS